MEVIRFLINNGNLIVTLSAVGALIISLIAIKKSSSDNRRQILVGKYEEIYALISEMIVEYDLLLHLYSTLQTYHQEDDAVIKYRHQNTFEEELGNLKQRINTDELFSKVIRLTLLTNTYLKKSLLFEVNAFCKLFEDLIITTTQREQISEETEFKEGFPTNENLYEFAFKISNKLIKKINLGSEIIDIHKFNDYLQNDFKKSLRIK